MVVMSFTKKQLNILRNACMDAYLKAKDYNDVEHICEDLEILGKYFETLLEEQEDCMEYVINSGDVILNDGEGPNWYLEDSSYAG